MAYTKQTVNKDASYQVAGDTVSGSPSGSAAGLVQFVKLSIATEGEGTPVPATEAFGLLVSEPAGTPVNSPTASVNGTPTEIIAADATRKGLSVINNGTVDLAIGAASNLSTTRCFAVLAPGAQTVISRAMGAGAAWYGVTAGTTVSVSVGTVV